MKVSPELISSFKELPSEKKLYFASDFHLGAPNASESLIRERKIVKWLQHISKDAAAIFLVGDIFDFWFEYKSTIPKGHIRFQAKITELADQGIPIFFFTGNHDLWMFDYFTKELNIPVYKDPIVLEVNSKLLFVGHGDGLGPGDRKYKFFKKIFKNPICQWFFQWVHPNIGVSLAQYWSKKSRRDSERKEDKFLGEMEPLLIFSKSLEVQSHHDFYIFGHRHMSLEMRVSEKSTYLNLGDWFKDCSYVEFDGQYASLKTFDI